LCPKDVGFEQQFGPNGIEDGLRRGGNPIDLEVFLHDEENIEIARRGFRGDKTAPSEASTQLSACAGESQERPKAA
jgi:hypothetical protein